MGTTATLKRLEYVSLVLSALALLATFLSLPQTPAAGWGWFVLTTECFALGLVVAAFLLHRQQRQTSEAPFLFRHRSTSCLWLVVRVYLGSVWLQAGLEKLLSPAWTQGGLALKGFWAGVLSVPAGPHPQIAYGWYRALLQALLVHHTYPWFAWVITLSELTIGILLLLGLFTALAAFAGGGLNLLYLLAGSAGINPIMLLLSLFLLLASKAAGWYGLDRFALSALAKLLRRPTAKQEPRQRLPSLDIQPRTTSTYSSPQRASRG